MTNPWLARTARRALIASLAALPACTPAPNTAADARANTRANEARPSAEPRALRESHRGLEVRVWLAENDAELTAALDGLTPLDTADAERWAASGLALKRLPVDRVPAVRDRVVRGAVRQSRWIGQPPEAVRLIESPTHDPVDAVRVAGVPVPLDRGRAELHVRAWSMPRRTETGIEPTLAVELAVAHRRATAADPFAVAVRPPDPTAVLLDAAVTLRPGEALLLAHFDPADAPAAPRLDRAASAVRVPPRDAVAGPRTERTSPEPDAAAPETLAQTPADTLAENEPIDAPRPPPPRPPTLGELLIPDLPGPLRGSTRRPVLVLVPRLPASSLAAPQATAGEPAPPAPPG